MDIEKFTMKDFWKVSEQGSAEHLRRAWRIVHLLGNPWVLDVLTELGKPGLTFAELRFFLCDDSPKRKGIDDRLRELKESLSDKPALDFHLPSYRTTSQLSRDVTRLRKDGLLTFDGMYHCLEEAAFNNLVYEWEKNQDATDVMKYSGDEVLRFDSHVRMYGLSRALFSAEDRGKLESIADNLLDLVAEAYQVESRAKIRAWRKAGRELQNSALPKSVTNRLLNRFRLFEAFPIISHRFFYDDTSTLILAEMIRTKEAELMHHDIEGRLSNEARDSALIGLMMKYTTLPNDMRKKGRNRSRSKVSKRRELPGHLDQPPFSNPKEKETFDKLDTYTSSPQRDESNHVQTAQIASAFGLSMDTLDALRSLRISVCRGLTVVTSTPHLPFVQNALYAATEMDFMDRIPPRDIP